MREIIRVGLSAVRILCGYRLTASTGPWFAWANSVFAQTILDLAKRKPHLLFGKGAEAYTLD
jgi:hypothetical protein